MTWSRSKATPTLRRTVNGASLPRIAPPVTASAPLATARSFREAGANWLHIVDLDGAKEGRPLRSSVFSIPLLPAVGQDPPLTIGRPSQIRRVEM